MAESKDPIDILLVLKQDASLELTLNHIRVSMQTLRRNLNFHFF